VGSRASLDNFGAGEKPLGPAMVTLGGHSVELKLPVFPNCF